MPGLGPREIVLEGPKALRPFGRSTAWGPAIRRLNPAHWQQNLAVTISEQYAPIPVVLVRFHLNQRSPAQGGRPAPLQLDEPVQRGHAPRRSRETHHRVRALGAGRGPKSPRAGRACVDHHPRHTAGFRLPRGRSVRPANGGCTTRSGCSSKKTRRLTFATCWRRPARGPRSRNPHRDSHETGLRCRTRRDIL